MKMRVLLGVAGLGAAAIVIGQMNVGASDTGAIDPTSSGEGAFVPTGGDPDVWVFKISGLSNWSETGYRAYSVGTTSCNTGNGNLIWSGSTPNHPVIGQAMYKYAPNANGHPVMKMVGQSWLKHGFCALDQTECTGACVGTGCGSLGLGCSDPYTSGRNGSQGPAGPKYQVNATTGVFPYPPADPSYSGATARRLRVDQAEVNGGSAADTKFFIEAAYVHYQDSPSTTDNANNNASYRQVTLTSSGFASSYVGLTVQQLNGGQIWGEQDPTVTTEFLKVPGEGGIWVAWNTFDNGDGTWDYEYLIHNMNLDRSIGAFNIPMPENVAISDVRFHDVDYHSNDGLGNQNFDGTDWDVTQPGAGGGMLTWATEDFATNASANAIRWQNSYSFGFTANTPPSPNKQLASLGVFKPGTPNLLDQKVTVPSAGVVIPCPEDLDGSGDVGFGDILTIIGVWGCTTCPAEDLSGNGNVDFADILAVIAAWGSCP
ncbi:MAG: hypothetical protein GY715_11470 [Planctomycetes bacterium]|nr:hypothetical protein [Planctomycetota bacterium]